MEDPHSVFFAFVALSVAVYIVRWRTHPLYSIPTVGCSSAPGLSYWAALRFVFHARELIEEGHYKYQNAAFRIATPDQWLVILSGPKVIEDLRRRPEDEMSLLEGVSEIVEMKHVLGKEATEDPYHLEFIKDKLTRMLSTILPDVIEELESAIHERIPAKDDEWLSVNALETMQQIVAQATNRVFVGIPTCRNQDYLDLVVAFTRNVARDRLIMSRIPYLLKPFVSRLISKANKSMNTALGYLKPVIEDRRTKMVEYGENWEAKPNDLLQWLLDKTHNKQTDDLEIVQRVLLTNFAALHTSAATVTQALYDLASRPEYIEPLRKEIETTIRNHGWTKDAMGQMWKVDSFLRESQRMNGIGLTSLRRRAMKDVTLNDGTFIPKGTFVTVASHLVHQDETNYAEPNVFDPFRFARLREQEGQENKWQYAYPSLEYLSFGNGKHACPGRFFVTNELKVMLAHFLLNFDIKLGGDGTRPADLHLGLAIIPSLTGQVMFRKRRQTASLE